MIASSIARRYAKALFGLAQEAGRIDAWAEALARVRAAAAQSPELRDVLANPVYTAGQRRAVLARVAAELQLDPEPTHLLFLLSDRGRLDRLDAVADAYTALADAAGHRVRARVTSAFALDVDTQERLAARLSRATGAEVLLEAAVDPELLGGVVAQVGHLTYDGSVRTQLEALRRTMKS